MLIRDASGDSPPTWRAGDMAARDVSGDCPPAGRKRRVWKDACERRGPRRGSGGFDLEDLELQRAAGCDYLDGVAFLAAHDRLADRRFVRELVLGGFASAEPTMWYSTVLLASMSRRRTVEPTETLSLEISFFVITRADSSRPRAGRSGARASPARSSRRRTRRSRRYRELAGNADPLRYFAGLFRFAILDLLSELLVALLGETTSFKATS